jgi:hypothetical protein
VQLRIAHHESFDALDVFRIDGLLELILHLAEVAT